jgi:hypothetical protein
MIEILEEDFFKHEDQCMVDGCCVKGAEYCLTYVDDLKPGFWPLTYLCSKHYKAYIADKLDPFRMIYHQDDPEYELE